MMRIFLLFPLFVLLTSACSETTRVEDELPQAQTDVSNPTGRTETAGPKPGERAVRIGEGGPRFDACQAVGRAQGLRGRDLDVKIAPFDSADQKASIGEGQLVYICTRSHDQQWFGIVYDDGAPATGEGEKAAPVAATRGPGDCGVSSPVRSKRNYEGSCKSGWVESNFVKLVAG